VDYAGWNRNCNCGVNLYCYGDVMADPGIMIDAHITVKVLWGITTVLMGVMVWMVKGWIKGVTTKLGCKQDKVMCTERYPKLDRDIKMLFKHKHPIYEDDKNTGEVIIP